MNYERIQYWIGNGAVTSTPVEQLLGNLIRGVIELIPHKSVLGMAGFYPIHPTSYMTAWRNRQKIEAEKAKVKEE